MVNDLEIITLDESNIDSEHICCAISDKKNQPGVDVKKNWLKERIKEGLKFKKYNVRHKVFIEYIPSEYAWAPVNAPNYLFINCLWVAGSYKKKGLGKNLLNECLKDAKEMEKDGVIAIVGKKKKPFLSDKVFFEKQGFEVCDSAPPFFELVVKYLNDSPKEKPYFLENAKSTCVENKSGLTITYTSQCPFTELYVKEVEEVAKGKGIPVETIKYNSLEEAKKSTVPFTTHAVFYKGEFVTHEILNEKRFDKFINVES